MTTIERAKRLETVVALRAEIARLRAAQIAIAPDTREACEVLAKWLEEAKRFDAVESVLKSLN